MTSHRQYPNVPDVPFYSNTPDDTHCFQAALRMVFKHLLPEKEFTWEELEALTAKKDGLWTWQLQGMISAKEMGLEVRDIDLFNYPAFIEKGEDYLLQTCGEEVGRAQIENSDIAQERRLAKVYEKAGIHEYRLPDLTDIERLLAQGHLIICNINLSALNGEPGYIGHFVVVYGIDNANIHFHDPGLPPRKNRIANRGQFVRAWEHDSIDNKNILAFRKNR